MRCGPTSFTCRTAMLVGMAREIRRRLNVPIVCTLSGEDIFLEKLTPPWYQQAREALRERVQDVTAFVALNRYYADFMVDYAAIERDKIHVIPHGLKLAGHGTRQLVRPTSASFAIGYFARICEDKGLHHLVDAFYAAGEGSATYRPSCLRGGIHGRGGSTLLRTFASQAARGRLARSVPVLGELDRAGKIDFLSIARRDERADRLSREQRACRILEAWANAVPVVLPAHGTFPELIEDTGGGVLHEPENPQALAAALRQMILDPAAAARTGACGAAGDSRSLYGRRDGPPHPGSCIAAWCGTSVPEKALQT